ncbi:transmembrane protein 69-like [Lingula anatina]|uniref:Transmembrane protein 69-like n=1 Tax=Lingula anatina TaxID=7574 RepID=A0A1S3JXU2_LINAN|nr:transmembrane protein 69-like [Lingula anatina]|eukprot:XP_013415198.1 transmembrane protein 69-like [Lingula anatina]
MLQLGARCLGSNIMLQCKARSAVPLINSLNGHQKCQVSVHQARLFSVTSNLNLDYKDQIKQLKKAVSSGTEPVKPLISFLKAEIPSYKSAPDAAKYLGLGGLVPFVLPPLHCLFILHMYDPNIAYLQALYGGCILSFLGGVRWGFSLPSNGPLKPDFNNLSISVAPPLIAWGGLMLGSPGLSIFVTMCGLSGAAYLDSKVKAYPKWYHGLRYLLTVGAVSSLFLTLVLKALLKSKDQEYLPEGVAEAIRKARQS